MDKRQAKFQSLAWLLKGAADDVITVSDPSRSVWDTRKDGGDWKEWRLTAQGIDEVDFEALFASGTGVGALG